FVIPDLFRPKAGTSPSFLPLQVAMVVVGVVSALLIILTTLKVRERPEFTQVDQPIPLGPALRFTFTSRSFLVLVAQNWMTVLMQSLVVGMLFYLADYVLQMNTLVVLACVFLPLIVGVPVTAWFRRRLGVAGAQQVLLLIAGIGLVTMPFVPNALVLPCLMLAGFGLSGPQTLTNVLFAQVADEDEVRSGVRREGAFFGINALLTKPAQSIALALIPFVLESTAFVTREANRGEILLQQPASALFGIKVLAGLIPGVAMLAGALLLRWYPLQGRYLEQVQARVLGLHGDKHERLVQGG
ncbi:MAG TPA: MFS transporter, partial [Anaerolineae bacterium]|nr:MFS transporter [Anaerolineae bacterium]